MANWQITAELQGVSADLPYSTQTSTEFSTRFGLDITGLETNHISLRCHQSTTAERWRYGSEQCGRLLSEDIINGRPVYLFKLHKPVRTQHWQFSIVELPWSGKKRYSHEGWEHTEVALPEEAETLNTRALALLSDRSLSQSGIFMKTSSSKREHERLPNPTPAVSDGNVAIKFHPWPIGTIVTSERQK